MRYGGDHWQRLREDLDRVFRETSFYQGTAAAHPVPPDPGAIAEWIARVPPIAKRDVRRNFPKGWIPRDADLNAELAAERVLLLATSGTTEDRVQVLWDAGWWDAQEREAMRVNRAVARALDAAAYKEAVLSTPVCAGNVCHIGDLSMAERTDGNILFLNQVADPTYWKESDFARIADEIDAFKPIGVEADPAYLAALSRWIAGTGRRVAQPAFIQLTYEFTTKAALGAIARAFDAKPVQLYGSTECGVLFMECEAGRLHANPRWTHVDLVPAGEVADGAGRLVRVLATTIGRRWMPLVRFDQGDLLLADESGAPCPCGRADGPVVRGVEGRVGDLTWTADRRPVTPAAVDRALAPISNEGALVAWQISQEGPDAVTLSWVGERDSVGRDAAGLLGALYGTTVRAERVTAVLPEGSGKYRPARCEVAELGKGTRLSKERGWESAAA